MASISLLAIGNERKKEKFIWLKRDKKMKDIGETGDSWYMGHVDTIKYIKLL